MKATNIVVPEFLKGVKIVGTLSDCTTRLCQEAPLLRASQQNAQEVIDVSTEQDPIVLMSDEVRKAYRSSDYNKIKEIEEKSRTDLEPLYSSISENGESAWMEAEDSEGKRFFTVFNNNGLIWAYPQETKVANADGETKYLHVTSIGVYSYNAAIGRSYNISFRSTTGKVIEVILDTALALVITKLIKKGVNYGAQTLAIWMAERAAAAGAEHYAFMISTRALKGITMGLDAIITFAGIVFIDWIIGKLDKKFYVYTEIYNWDASNGWKLKEHYESNAKTGEDDKFKDVVLPKKEVPKIPPFIKDIKVLNTAVSYATIVWENDNTFMQGLGVAFSMQKIGVNEGFTWALDCPWVKDTTQKAVNQIESDLSSFYKSGNWNQTPLYFTITEPSGTPISFMLNAKNRAKNNTYNVKINIGGTTKVKVEADRPWNDTGVDLSSSSSITIQYDSGKWSVSPDCRNLDGNGGFYTAKNGYLLPGSPEGCLVGKLGDNGQPFYVGNKLTLSGKSGRLYLGANDDMNGTYGQGYKDNTGALNVLISED